MLTRARAIFAPFVLAAMLLASPAAFSQDDVAGHAPAAAAHVPAGSVPEEHAQGAGFPQLDASTYASQVFWLVVSFALLFVLMSGVALPRVAETLEGRRAKRQSNLDEAETASAEAAKVTKAFEASLAKAHAAAQELMLSAEREAADKAAAESAAFAESARKRLADADRAIGAAKDAALASIADIAADLAADITARVANVQTGKAEAKAAVAQLMKRG